MLDRRVSPGHARLTGSMTLARWSVSLVAVIGVLAAIASPAR